MKLILLSKKIYKIEEKLCLFAFSWIEIEHETKHCQGESLSILMRKMYKIEEKLCLFAFSWIEIEQETKRCQGQSLSILMHKGIKKKLLKGKWWICRWEKMSKVVEELLW